MTTMACADNPNCDCNRRANPGRRRARRAARKATTMGASWLNNSATISRFARESAVRGGYETGYYRPMIVPPMGSLAGNEEFSASVVLISLALNVTILGLAGYGAYKLATRDRQ